MYYNVIDRDEVKKDLEENMDKIEDLVGKPENTKEAHEKYVKLMYAQLCKGLPLSTR